MFSIKDILIILQNRVKLIVIVTVFFCLFGLSYTYFVEKPVYTAQATLFVLNDSQRTEGTVSTGELSVSKQLVNTYLVVLKSETTLSKVSEKLKIQGYDISESDIAYMLSVGGVDETEAFHISITHSNPQLAALITNTIVEVAPSEIIRVVEAGSVKVIDYAKVPTIAYYPIVKNTFLASGIGFVLITLLIIIQGIFDTTIHDEQVIKDNFSIPIIGQIPSYGSKDVDNYSNYKFKS